VPVSVYNAVDIVNTQTRQGEALGQTICRKTYIDTCCASIDETWSICRPVLIELVNQSPIELCCCVVGNNSTWRPLFPAVHLHTSRALRLLRTKAFWHKPPGQNF